jgi:hypothetical protein
MCCTLAKLPTLFPVGREKHEEDEKQYEHAEENTEEEEEEEEEEDEHKGKGKQRAVAQGVPRGGSADDSNNDNRTVVGPVVQRIKVTIKKHRFSSKLTFVDAKGNERVTTREEWKKVPGGYQLMMGRKNIYFTKHFP